MSKVPPKKSALIAAVVIATSFAGVAQAEWLKTYDNPGLDIGMSFPSSQGGFYQSSIGSPNTKFSALALINEQGEPVWRRKISSGGIDQLFASELANRQLLVSGSTQTTAPAPSKPVWAKFNVNRATGKLTPLFSLSLNQGVDGFYAFEETSTSKILGLGLVKTGSQARDMLVTRINPTTGQNIWARVLNAGPLDFFYDLRSLGANNYLLMGGSTTKPDTSDLKIIIGKLDSQGRPINSTFKKFGADGGSNTGTLLPISNGNYLLVGSTTSTTNNPMGIPVTSSTAFAIKLDSSLRILWKKSFSAGAGTKLSTYSAIQNGDGTLIISANYSPAFSFTDPFSSYKQYPITIKLASNGALLNSKRYEFGDSGSGTFMAATGGGYIFSGSLFTLTNIGIPQLAGGIYGKFNAQLEPVWNKALADASTVNLNPTTDGFWLSGMHGLFQANDIKPLLGQVNGTGDIPGCAEIEPIAPKIVNAGITQSNLAWTPKPTVVSINTSVQLTAKALPLSNQQTTLPTVTTLCD